MGFDELNFFFFDLMMAKNMRMNTYGSPNVKLFISSRN
jgi:hypothetical protein